MLSKSYSSSVDSLDPAILSGLFGSSASKLFVQKHLESNKCSLIVCKDNSHAEEIISQVKFFSGMSEEEIIFFPELETLPYDSESPNSSLISKRISAVQKLISGDLQGKIIIATSFSASTYMMPVSYWKKNTTKISKNVSIEKTSFLELVNEYGYSKQDNLVSHYCEYVVHNNIVDIMPSTSNDISGFRLNFSDSGVLSKISLFDIVTQQTLCEVDSFNLSPAYEIPLNEEGRKKFRTSFVKAFKQVSDPIYTSISKMQRPQGIEFYLSLFGADNTLLSFLPEFNLFFFDSAVKSLEKKEGYFYSRYEELMALPGKKILEPERIISSFLAKENLSKNITASMVVSDDKGFDCQYISNDAKPQHSINDMVSMLSGITVSSSKLILSLSNADKSEQLRKLSIIMRNPASFADSWLDALKSESKVVIVNSPLEEGFRSLGDGVTLVTEKELFGVPIRVSDHETSININQNEVELLRNVKKGDLVIHQKFGIAKFNGFKKHQMNKDGSEFLSLEFAENSVIYLGLSEISNINKYDNLNPDDVKLDKYDPSGSRWKKDLEAAFEGISETAFTLIDYQLKKQNEVGVSIPKPSADYVKFCREFPYEATRDQLLAVSEIEEDLISNKPMDRLISGDVGFGKTEIAQRASMICAASGFQVVLVAPTSLLCHQHYLSFKERFSGFDIPICELSSASKEEDKIFRGIATGHFKIVIATHKAFSNKLKPSNLGLVIIDEEHRFGVKQKEKIRSSFAGVNFMSMTATPIPRTLKASLSGIKDTSVLSTPPAARLSIITKVSNFDDELIKQSIDRELMRDGQAFFIHNNTSTIYNRADQIRALIPGLRVAVMHGKMHALEIEKTMTLFRQKEYDVLVATTVIETGIDVPNSNTILIESSENFGLAALHQLRGRVGRSKRQGYCFLLTSSDEVSDVATKRLKAMEEASGLGEGYRLANYDLEIRGAGDLLGEGQSGHISKLGFDTYQKILDKCVSIIKDKPDIKADSLFKLLSLDEDTKIVIDAGIAGEIPDSYIPDESIRLYYYKALSLASTDEEITQLKIELEDRFGAIPSELLRMIDVAYLKSQADKFSLQSVKAIDGNLVFSFEKGLSDSDPIMKLYMKDPDHAEIKTTSEGSAIVIPQSSGGTSERLVQLKELLAS